MVRTLRLEKACAAGAALCLAMALAGAGCSKSLNSMSVVSTSPAANSSGNSTGTQVQVKFSSSVKESSLNSSSFVVSGSDSGVMAGSLSYTDSTRMATFQPTNRFKDGEKVTVDLKSSIQGKSGASLSSRRFQFSIKPAAVVPPPPPPPPPPADGAVKGRTPAPFATHIAVDTTVIVQFTERMDPLTFTRDTVRLEGDLGGAIDIQIGDVAVVGNRVSILPRRHFLAGEWITVSLSSSLRTAAGGKFPGDSFGFRAATLAPAGALRPGPTFSTGGPIQLFRLADVDQDGLLDIVYVFTGDSKVKIARGLGATGFEPAVELDAGRTIISLTVADLEPNGRMDVLVGSTDRAVVFRGQGTGISFSAAQVLATGTNVRGIAVGNIDRTGPPDVILDTDRGLRLYLNGLSGSPALTIGEVRVSRTDLGLSDLNLDGALDLVYGDTTGDRLGYHRAGGDAFLLPEETIALGGDALWLRVEDLDRDGKPEIVVNSASATSANLEIHTFSGQSGGAVPSLQPMPLESGRRFELADFSGTGVASLVASDPEAAKVLLFHYLDGQFDLAHPVELASGYSPSGLRAGDITGDGVLDLVVSANGDFHLLVSEGASPPPPAALAVESLEAHQGDTGRQAMVRLTSSVPVEGFSIALSFDPQAVASPSFDLAGTVTAGLTPEFVAPAVNAQAGNATLAVAFDMLPPFDGRTLAAGDALAIAAFKFDVPATAPEGVSALTLADGLGTPPVSNTVSSDGSSISPQLASGTLTVRPAGPPPPQTSLSVASLDVTRGESGRTAAIKLSSSAAAEGFTVALKFDPRVVAAPSFDLAGTASAALAPEFVSPGIHAQDGYASLAVAFDLLPPFDGRTLAAGNDLTIANLKFDVPADAPEGASALELKDGLGTPAISNVVTSGGSSISPQLTAGTLTVHAVAPPPAQARLSIDSLTAAAGDSGKKAVIHLDSNVGVDAFQVILAFDPRAITVTGMDIDATASADLHPEFFSPGIHAGEGYASLGVSFDLLPPFDGRILAPGDNIALANLKFDVPADAPGGTYPIEFKDGLGTPPAVNYVHAAGKTITPTKVAGSLTVSAPPNPNSLRVQSVTVAPGSAGNRASVLLTCVEDVEAYTVIGVYDPAATVIRQIDTAGSVTGPLNPEFVIPSIRPDDRYFSYTVIFDFSPPFDRQHISPASDQKLFTVVFDVPASVAKGEYHLQLQNSVGTPPLSNSLVNSQSLSMFPDLLPGGVVTVADKPPAPKFIRGDVNHDGKKPDISDHIFLISYLFYHGTEPPCLEAADVDDNGKLNLVDTVNLLGFIFNGTPVPPLPAYPTPGEDPTPDDLGCLQGQ
jgi:Big-like domain-containing protein/VCBS repeat protein